MAVDMRKEITKAYASTTWAAKVKKMSDRQVLAVYLRLKAQGKV